MKLEPHIQAEIERIADTLPVPPLWKNKNPRAGQLNRAAGKMRAETKDRDLARNLLRYENQLVKDWL